MAQCDITTARPGNASGIKLPYGEGPDGRLLHISEVQSGLACGCVCPECRESLVARKGPELTHHFGHRSASNCFGAYETMLHKLAKQIVADRRCIMVPARRAEHAGVVREIAPAQLFRVDEVHLEQWRDGVKPDIVAQRTIDGIMHELHIEVRVTHPCGPEKIAFLRERKMASMEIDLSHLDREATPEQIEEQVIRAADRVWLYNGHVDQAQEELRLELEREAAKARAKAERKKREAAARARSEARRLVETLRSSVRASPQTEATGSLLGHIARVRGGGLDPFVGIEVKGAACFRVTAAAWQSLILGRFVMESGSWHRFRTKAALECVRPFLRSGLRLEIPPDVADAARQLDPNFGTAQEAIEAYLAFLRGRGILEYWGDSWLPRSGIAEKAKASLKEVSEGRRRAAQLQEQVETLLARLPAESPITAASWMETPLPKKNRTPRQLAISDSWAARDLASHIGRLADMLIPGSPVEDDLLGLPLREQHRQRAAEWAITQEEKRRAEAERARIAAEAERSRAAARKQKVVEYALHWLGQDEGERWLAKPLRTLNGTSIAALEGLTDAQYELAWRVVTGEYERQSAEGDRRAKIERLQHDLQMEAVSRLGQNFGAFWMAAQNRLLGGRKPIEVCVDPIGQKLCWEALHKEHRRFA